MCGCTNKIGKMARRRSNKGLQENGMMALFLGLGLVGAKLTNNLLPGTSMVKNLVKVGGGLAIAGMVKNETVKSVALGVAAEGVYNVASPIVSQTVTRVLPPATLRGINSGASVGYQTVPTSANNVYV